MAPVFASAEESERFWKYLRALETSVETLKDNVASLQLDLDRERKRSIAVHHASGRNKWASLVGACVTILIVLGQVLEHFVHK